MRSCCSLCVFHRYIVVLEGFSFISHNQTYKLPLCHQWMNKWLRDKLRVCLCAQLSSRSVAVFQTQPLYLAQLIFSMPQSRSTAFMEMLVFSLFNYGSDHREAFLLLQLFTAALRYEIRWHAHTNTDTFVFPYLRGPLATCCPHCISMNSSSKVLTTTGKQMMSVSVEWMNLQNTLWIDLWFCREIRFKPEMMCSEVTFQNSKERKQIYGLSV